MWLQDLRKIYTEGWGPSSPNLPGDSKATTPPAETRDSLRMKGVFASGDSPSNMAAVSMASGQNPYEQEEERAISKKVILDLIEDEFTTLSHTNTMDRSAILALSTLKKKLNKL